MLLNNYSNLGLIFKELFNPFESPEAFD